MRSVKINVYPEIYEQIKNGRQRIEIRPANHKTINSRTVWPGVPLRFTTKENPKESIKKYAYATFKTYSLSRAGISRNHIDIVQRIYPTVNHWFVIYFR